MDCTELEKRIEVLEKALAELKASHDEVANEVWTVERDLNYVQEVVSVHEDKLNNV